MDRTNGPQQTAILRGAVRGYIDDLITNHAIWLGGYWRASEDVNMAVVRRLTSLVCSTCQYENTQTQTLVINFRVPSTTPAAADAQIATVHLPAKVLSCLQGPTPSRSIAVWLKVRFCDSSGRCQGSHITVIIFDTKKRLQIVFDPDWPVEISGNCSSALCRRQFHPSYRNCSVAECAETTHAAAIQARLENVVHIDEGGLCSCLAFVVMLCCFRFHYFNPKHIAHIIVDYIDHPGRHDKANSLIDWWISLRNRTGDSFRQKVFPAPSDGYCKVFGTSSGRCCPRKVCNATHNDRSMCWQHLHLVRRVVGQSKKCMAPFGQCPV